MRRANLPLQDSPLTSGERLAPEEPFGSSAEKASDRIGGDSVVGYAHPDYARSLAEFGEPRELPWCGGWFLERETPNGPYRDGMGMYPLFVCRNWSKLPIDLRELADRLVSLTIVADPFGAYTVEDLGAWFDIVRILKTRHVVNLRRLDSEPPSRHHRDRAKRGLRNVDVEILANGAAFLDRWVELYSHLAARHGISGIQAFSREAFRLQLEIPGLVLFRAARGDATVGMHLWYERGDVAYSHLMAFDPSGYKIGAAYALHDAALRYFAPRVRWLDLGGGAGLKVPDNDGLVRFKQGWANEERPSFLCGRIFNLSIYNELRRDASANEDYFPAYRFGRHAPRGEK